MLDRPAAVALGLGAAGVLYRLCLLLVDTPPTNSDEATMGLAALHIADGRDFPAFFYGQGYMGTLEAYLAAPLFWLFGPSTLALRMPALLLYAAFVFLAYKLTRRLYPPWLAVATVAVLALGADRVIKNQLIAAGGYPEISPLAVVLFLLALARPRPVTALAFGLVAGLLVWDDWLILPYLAAAVAVLLVRVRDLRLLALTALATVVGAVPLLVHLQSSLSEFVRLNEGGGGLSRYNAVLFGIPMGTGLCSPSHCAPWQMWWGVAYPVLLVAAAVLGVRAALVSGPLRRPRRQAPDQEEWLRQVGRLALVAGAALTLLGYARSAAAAETPVESARYLSTLLISTPAVLWPLWTVPRYPPTSPKAIWFGGVAVAGLLGTMLFASGALVTEAPAYADRADRYRELASTLESQGITRVYSEYWTCNLIILATDERVICAVVGDDLSPGVDRYQPYRRAVAEADHPAYVAPIGSPLDTRLQTPTPAPALTTPTLTTPGYHIYR